MRGIFSPSTIAVVLFISAAAAAADAQTTPRRTTAAPRRVPIPPRSYVLGGVSFVFAASDFTDHRVIKANAEDGSFEASYANPGATGFEVATGLKLWKYLGARVGLSRHATDTAADLTLSVPHPFFFQRPRTLSSSVDGLRHEETWIHAHALAMFAANRNLQVSVYGGPSFLNMQQDAIGDVTYTDTFPYDSITLGQVTTMERSASKVTFGAGADVLYFFSKRVGVAGTVAFASAKTTFDTANQGRITVNNGGPRLSAGVSIRFP